MSGRTQKQWDEQCQSALDSSRAKGLDYVAIPLTQEQRTLVGVEDYELVRDTGPWYATWAPSTKGFYAKGRIEGKLTYLHRVIVNPRDDEDVDHIDHNTLDNRRLNLRVATVAQNQGNQRPRKGASSKYKGVYWNKIASKWQAYIKAGGIQQTLGYFDCEEEAARAYNAAALETFGEFAKLNGVEKRKEPHDQE